MAVLIFVQTSPPLWYCCHMSSYQHALSPSLPPLGSLVRVLWYGGDPDVVPTMSGIVLAVEPDWGTAEVLVTSTGSGGDVDAGGAPFESSRCWSSDFSPPD